MNDDEMERGHQDGDETNSKDQDVTDSYWRDRFEELIRTKESSSLLAMLWKEEAEKVKLLEAELERSERNQLELLEEETAKVTLLRAELNDSSMKLESERAQRELLEELLGTENSNRVIETSGPFIMDREGIQAQNPIADNSRTSSQTATLPRRPDDGLSGARNSYRPRDDQPRSSGFLDEKYAMANKRSRQSSHGVVGATSINGDRSYIDQKIARNDRSANRNTFKKSATYNRDSDQASGHSHTSVTPNVTTSDQPRHNSFLDRKNAMANRGSKQTAVSGNASRIAMDGQYGGRRGFKKWATHNRSSGQASARGSFFNLKLAVASRRKKGNSAGNLEGTGRRTADNWLERGTMDSSENIGDTAAPSEREGVLRQPLRTTDTSMSFTDNAIPPMSVSRYALNEELNEEEAHSQFRSAEETKAEDNETGGDQPIVAHLVDESPPLISTIGTVVDTKRHRIMTALKAFFLAAIVAIVTSISVVYTRPDGKSVTPSPTSSLEPSASPSSIPSASPSTGMFGFLAAHSFDDGLALSTPGTAQRNAMDWLKMNVRPTFDYEFLQYYVLATLYYSTFGNQWTSTEYYQLQRLSANPDTSADFSKDWLNNTSLCDWQGVLCNNLGEINSLQLSSNRLFGLIPSELAVLDRSLSKILRVTSVFLT